MSSGFSFNNLLDNMDKGFVLRKAIYDDANEVSDFQIVYCNKAMDNYTKIPFGSLIGLTIKKNYSKEQINPILSVLIKVLQTGLSCEAEYYSFTFGRYVKVFAFRPMADHVACVYEHLPSFRQPIPETFDIESKTMELSNSTDEVFWMRKGDRILYVNPAFEKIFGLPCCAFYEDIYSILETVDPVDYGRVDNVLKNDGINLETNYDIEFRVKNGDGGYKWVWMKTFFIRELTGEIVKKAASVKDITERKLMEEELLRQNHEIKTLYELFKKAAEHISLKELFNKAQRIIIDHIGAAGVGIYLYNEDTGKFKLESAERATGKAVDNEELLTILALPDEVFDSREIRIIPVSEHPNKALASCLKEEGYPFIINIPIVYSDKILGALSIPFGTEMAPHQKEFVRTICNQLAVIIYNIRLYEQLAQELEMRIKAEKENELIFKTSIDLLVMLDIDGQFIRVSPQCEKCLGWATNELLTKNILELVHTEDLESTVNVQDQIKRTGVVLGHETRILCKDGSYRWIAWNAQFAVEEHRKLIIAIGRDITPNKEMEDKNRQLERAYQLETVKMEFFANISHEFRTPLNIILSALQLIQHSVGEKLHMNPLHERHYRHLKSIKQNAFRLLRLVNNLIDITKLDSGYFKLYPGNHNIVRVIESIVESASQYIEGKGISLVFDTDVEEKILAFDGDLIERILLNLLSNAVKYTEKGGYIKVTVHDLGDWVRIVVKDTGVGIPEDKLDSIFERFVQGEKPLTRRCEGSGIGLSLVKSLVELHKGRIYVKSSLNEGSEFIFELPVCILDKDAHFQGIEPSREERIHKINVEFSDIYSADI